MKWKFSRDPEAFGGTTRDRTHLPFRKASGSRLNVLQVLRITVQSQSLHIPPSTAMAITVHCPGCSSKLGVADNAAGKKVKCPKCARCSPCRRGMISKLSRRTSTSSKTTRISRSWRNRPRRRRNCRTSSASRGRSGQSRRMRTTRKKKTNGRGGRGRRSRRRSRRCRFSVGLGIAAVLLLGVGAFFMLGGEKWTKFTTPDGSVTAQFPGGTPTATDFFDVIERPAMTRRRISTEARAGADMMKAMGITMDAWQYVGPKRRYVLGMVTLPEAVAGMVKPDDIMKGFEKTRSERQQEIEDHL